MKTASKHVKPKVLPKDENMAKQTRSLLMARLEHAAGMGVDLRVLRLIEWQFRALVLTEQLLDDMVQWPWLNKRAALQQLKRLRGVALAVSAVIETNPGDLK